MAAPVALDSWSQYRLIADNSHDVVYECRPSGEILWIQPTVEGLLGWTPDDLLGVEAMSLVHPDDLAGAGQLRAAVYAGAQIDEAPCRIRSKAGGFRTCTVRARPVLAEDGTVTSAVMTLRDVHRQTAALRALATLSQGNRVLVRAGGEGDLLELMCDAIVQAGDYPLVWYGRPLDDDGRTVVPVAAAGAQRDYLDDIRVSWGEGPLGQGPTGTALRTRRSQLRHDLAVDPGFRPWSERAAGRGIGCAIALPVIVDDEVDGALVVYGAGPGSFDDLAERLLEDLAADLGIGLARLRDNERLTVVRREATASALRLRATLDSLLDPFALLESVRDGAGRLVDLRYVEANAAAAAYNGMEREELLGRTMLELFPGLYDHGPLAAYFDAVETGEPMVLDDVPYRNELLGQERRYDLRGIRTGDGLALCWRDVTERFAERAALARTLADYRLLAEHASDFVTRSTPEGIIDWVSPSVTRALGWTPEELLGREGAILAHPDDVAQARRGSRKASAARPLEARFRARHKDGTHSWFHVSARPVLDDGGAVTARVSAWRDIQQEVVAEQAKRAADALFHRAMEAASIGMAVAGVDGRLRIVNESMCRMLDRDERWLRGHRFAEFVHPDDLAQAMSDRAELIEGVSGSRVRQQRLVRADGSSIWVRRSAVVIRDADDVPESIVIQIEDVTAERHANELLEFQAFHDPLTGLRNRTWIVDILEAELVAARAAGRTVAVLFLDLDHFQVVNDSLGHDAGDELLVQTARRIAAVLPATTHLGRFGGDEFVVVVPVVREAHEAELLADRVSAAVAVPLDVQGHRVVTAASLGIALSDAGSTAASMLRDSDAALFRAKAAGRARWQFVDEAMHGEAVARLTVEDELRRGLENHELKAHYQPIVSLVDGAVVGHEALVRWQHPERGLITPGEFLPVAEASGLVVTLGQQVLDQVCALLSSTDDRVGTMNVNVSAVQLGRAAWIDEVLDTLERHGADPHRLVLEVTETAVLTLPDHLRTALARLRGLGVGLHLDDFGTGYSSIAVLRELPITGIKLDRMFVSALSADGAGDADALSAGLASLAHNLHLTGIAEGVETELQRDRLSEHGWSHGQGYLFGRPAPEPLHAL